ncbi:MAG: septum formation inhibitor Maf, partial [Halieaceae bacterium]|nr:septum formation inhibitor Maf [Halieaceae bacterium]
VALKHPDALVIGSDQVVAIDDQILGKPGNRAAATAQLRASSGREVLFYTGLAVVCRRDALERVEVEPFSVHFRTLSDAAIEAYLRREQPYDCAGSFKWEGLGIVLFERLRGDDPTSLEGLPLIRLSTLLSDAGCALL